MEAFRSHTNVDDDTDGEFTAVREHVDSFRGDAVAVVVAVTDDNVTETTLREEVGLSSIFDVDRDKNLLKDSDSEGESVADKERQP